MYKYRAIRFQPVFFILLPSYFLPIVHLKRKCVWGVRLSLRKTFPNAARGFKFDKFTCKFSWGRNLRCTFSLGRNLTWKQTIFVYIQGYAPNKKIPLNWPNFGRSVAVAYVRVSQKSFVFFFSCDNTRYRCVWRCCDLSVSVASFSA